MIDVIARSQRLIGKEVYFPWGVDRNGINIEFTVEKKTGRKMKTYERAEFLEICKTEIEKYTQEMRNIAKRVGLSCSYENEYLTDSLSVSFIEGGGNNNFVLEPSANHLNIWDADLLGVSCGITIPAGKDAHPICQANLL